MLEKMSDLLWAGYAAYTRFIMRFVGERFRKAIEDNLRMHEAGRQNLRSIDRHYALVKEFQREYYDDFLIKGKFGTLDASMLAESHAFEHFLTVKRAKHANSPDHLAALETLQSFRENAPGRGK